MVKPLEAVNTVALLCCFTVFLYTPVSLSPAISYCHPLTYKQWAVFCLLLLHGCCTNCTHFPFVKRLLDWRYRIIRYIKQAGTGPQTDSTCPSRELWRCLAQCLRWATQIFIHMGECVCKSWPSSTIHMRLTANINMMHLKSDCTAYISSRWLICWLASKGFADALCDRALFIYPLFDNMEDSLEL